MQLTLIPHPAMPTAVPGLKLWASVERSAAFGISATLNMWFGIGAPAQRFVLPKHAAERSDALWHTTCFEAFLRRSGETVYREWNFAPSGAWAAYDFSGRREGMTEAEVDSPPYVRMEDNFTWWTVGATIAIDAEPNWEVGLSAVLEEQDGIKSYWALAHPDPVKPDFHHPDCFVARLP